MYFNISEMKLSITSLYIISDTPKYDIIWTENSDMIDSFISEILKYESSVIVSSTEKLWAVLFTPFNELLVALNPLLEGAGVAIGGQSGYDFVPGGFKPPGVMWRPKSPAFRDWTVGRELNNFDGFSDQKRSQRRLYA